jgi:hypothetical protein
LIGFWGILFLDDKPMHVSAIKLGFWNNKKSNVTGGNGFSAGKMCGSHKKYGSNREGWGVN